MCKNGPVGLCFSRFFLDPFLDFFYHFKGTKFIFPKSVKIWSRLEKNVFFVTLSGFPKIELKILEHTHVFKYTSLLLSNIPLTPGGGSPTAHVWIPIAPHSLGPY